jgi:hypothetical protein
MCRWRAAFKERDAGRAQNKARQHQRGIQGRKGGAELAQREEAGGDGPSQADKGRVTEPGTKGDGGAAADDARGRRELREREGRADWDCKGEVGREKASERRNREKRAEQIDAGKVQRSVRPGGAGRAEGQEAFEEQAGDGIDE